MAKPDLRSFFVLLLLAALLATLALVVRSGLVSRRNPGEPINAAMREAVEPEAYQLTAEEEHLITTKFSGAITTPSGLRYLVRRPGTGAPPKFGQTVTTAYEGRLLDGTKFDASADHEGPLSFPVGTGKVIPGWDEALLTMKKGEKRTLIIPQWLGYGIYGRAPTIPPRAILVFEIELLDIK